MHNVGASIPNIPRKGCCHAQVAATRDVVECGNKSLVFVVITSICSKSNVVNVKMCPQPSRCFCGERPRMYAFPCLWGNKSAFCEYPK